MRRTFPALAAVAAVLLMAGSYSGLVGRDDSLGRGVRLVAAASALGVHAWAFAYLAATGRRVEATAERLALPGWVGAQAEKNRAKALIYVVGGSLMAVAGASLVVGEWWHPIVSGSSVSFQVGSFLGEAMIVANQSRLLADLSDRAGLIRFEKG